MKSELGITVSVGVSFNKIFAKLGSDYKKPDAITTMYKSEFKQKAWSLPVAVSYGRLLMAMMIHLSSWRTPTLQSNPWGTAQRHQRI